MAVSIDMAAKRPVITYILVAIVLFASLLLCVRWVKSRTAHYSQTQVGQNQPAEQQQEGAREPEKPMTPAPQQSSESQSKPEDKQEHLPTPTQVPSTGPGQMAITAFSLGAVAFTATGYVRARRRLFKVD